MKNQEYKSCEGSEMNKHIRGCPEHGGLLIGLKLCQKQLQQAVLVNKTKPFMKVCQTCKTT